MIVCEFSAKQNFGPYSSLRVSNFCTTVFKYGEFSLLQVTVCQAYCSRHDNTFKFRDVVQVASANVNQIYNKYF